MLIMRLMCLLSFLVTYGRGTAGLNTTDVNQADTAVLTSSSVDPRQDESALVAPMLAAPQDSAIDERSHDDQKREERAISTPLISDAFNLL